MDPAASCKFHRLGAAVDVFRMHPRETGNNRILRAPGDLAHGLKIAFAR